MVEITQTNSAISTISNPSSNYINPYFVSNSDNTSNSLVKVLFNGNNYSGLSRVVRRALGAKNKEGFINGAIKEPKETDDNFEKWKNADYMVTCWILSSMNVEIAEDFESVTTSVQLWDELKARFGTSNDPLIYQLKKDIENLKQENLSLLNYFSKLKKLWDLLKDLRQMPTCTCGAMRNCICGLFNKLADFEEEEKCMQFLLVTNVITMEPLPTVNHTFAIAQKVEKKMDISQEATVESSAMVTQRAGKSSTKASNNGKKDWKKEKLDRFCTHCKTKGHNVEQCFKIIGYPEWYTALQGGKGDKKLAANTPVESPLDDSDDAATSYVNATVLNTIRQEIKKALVGQNQGGNGSDSSNLNALVNFAGPF